MITKDAQVCPGTGGGPVARGGGPVARGPTLQQIEVMCTCVMPEQLQNVRQAQGPTTQPPGSSSLFFFEHWKITVIAYKPKFQGGAHIHFDHQRHASA
jgi:hypothetical protein